MCKDSPDCALSAQTGDFKSTLCVGQHFQFGPPEYEDEHIEGAISIPLKNLDREAKERLDPDRPVVVY